MFIIGVWSIYFVHDMFFCFLNHQREVEESKEAGEEA